MELQNKNVTMAMTATHQKTLTIITIMDKENHMFMTGQDLALEDHRPTRTDHQDDHLFLAKTKK
jgi:hypothetical protein